MRIKYKIKRPEEIQTVLEKIKQKIQANVARLTRYQKLSHFYKDKILFKDSPKQLYRNISKSQIKANKAASKEEIRSFWEKVWSDSKTHNSQAPWTEKLIKKYEALKEQVWSEITLKDLKYPLKNLINENRKR